MKKYFDIQEKVSYSHRIEIEVDESQEDLFEELAEEIAGDMENGCYESKEDIITEFISAFNEDSVNFTEDGSPNITLESY